MLFGLNNLSKTTIIISVVVILVIGVGIYLYMKPTNEQFEENKDTSNNSKKLILFFSPNCGHCRDFMEGDNSTWNQLVKKYQENLQISEINCSENPELATNYSIVEFPTIKMFSEDGKESVYKGDRSIEDLSAFVESN